MATANKYAKPGRHLDMSVTIDMLGGNCPVQGEGTIDGKPFYFRARGEHWSIEIGRENAIEWTRRRKWGDGKYAAGWMEEPIARALIHSCADDYLAGTPDDNGAVRNV